jgi:hypothetical protein
MRLVLFDDTLCRHRLAPFLWLLVVAVIVASATADLLLDAVQILGHQLHGVFRFIG